jgi:hypothetical protein
MVGSGNFDDEGGSICRGTSDPFCGTPALFREHREIKFPDFPIRRWRCRRRKFMGF